MSLEEFARIPSLGPGWVEIRRECHAIVERANFWYRKELQSAAQELAVKASNMLVAMGNKAGS